MEMLRCGPRMLFVALGFTILILPVTAEDPAEAPAGSTEPEKEMERWQPRYKIRKEEKQTQRERRTGVSLEEREGGPGAYREPEPEEEQPKAKKSKRGFWPFKKKGESSVAAPTEAAEGGSGKKGFINEMKFWKKGDEKQDAGERASTSGKTSEPHAFESKPAGRGGEETGKVTKAQTPPDKEDKADKRPADAKETDKKRDAALDPAYQKGKESFDKGRYDKAISFFTQFLNTNTIKDNPLEAPANYFIAKSMENLGQVDTAIHRYREITEKYRDRQFWANLAALELSSLQGKRGGGEEANAPQEGGTKSEGGTEEAPTEEVKEK